MLMIKKLIFSIIATLFIITFTIQLQANNPIIYIAFSGNNLVEQTEELVMLGDTVINENGLMLTQDVNQTSGVFFNEAIFLNDAVQTKGYSLHYNFTVFKESDSLGEGIGFVFTNESPVLGDGGESLGFGNIDKSVSFELDFISSNFDFNSPHYGTLPTYDGAYIPGDRGVGLNLNLEEIYARATMGRRAFDLYVWMDYIFEERMMKLYVSTTPSRPLEPFNVSIRTDMEQIDNPVYLGITTSNTEHAMGLRLNEMYVSDYYLDTGFNLSSYDYVSDYNNPSPPKVEVVSIGGNLTFSVTGSSDDESGIRGYEYSYDLLNWNEGTLITSEQAETIYFRSFDRAFNRSDVVSYETFVLTFDTNNIGPSYERVLYVGQDFELDVGARNATFIITSWQLEDGTPITNASQLTQSITVYAQTQKHTYDVTYNVGDGNQEGNPTTYSILDDPFTLLPAKRSGYAFLGWFLEDERIETLSADIPEDITLVAQYEPLTLEYLIFGHGDQLQTLTLTTRLRFGSFSTVSVPTGYEFVGFYTEPFGQGERITAGTILSDVETFQAFPFIRAIESETSNETMLTVQSTFIDNPQTFNPLIFIPFIMLGVLIFTVRRGKHE